MKTIHFRFKQNARTCRLLIKHDDVGAELHETSTAATSLAAVQQVPEASELSRFC